MNFQIIKTLLFPLLKLDFKEKLIFLLIICFTFLLILFDILSVTLIAAIFIGETTSTSIEFITNFLNIIFDKFAGYDEIIILVFALIGRNIVFLLQEYILKSFVHQKYSKYATLLLGKYLNSEMSKFLENDTSFYLKNVTRETFYAFCGILYASISFISELIYLFLISIFLLTIISFNEFLIFLGFLILSGIIFLFMIKRIAKIGKSKLDYENKLFQDVNDTLLSFTELNVFKKVDYFLNIFSKNVHTYSKRLVIQAIFNISPKLILETLLALGLLVLYFNKFDFTQELNILITVGYVIYRFIPALSKCVSSLQTFSFSFATNELLERHFNYFKKNTKNNTDVNHQEIEEITIKNGKFKYKSTEENIITNFNATFKRGQITGIFGKSGTGKTTILNIITGLQQLNEGEIVINNVSYKDKILNWSDKMTYMAQNPFIINSSLSETLFLSKTYDESQKKMAIDYLINFNLKHLVKYFDADDISLRNILSGGEKQRISFIRCLLKNPQIMLLDEPTSSLDDENENLIIDYLKNIRDKKIIILSTHKQYLKKKLDQILIIN